MKKGKRHKIKGSMHVHVSPTPHCFHSKMSDANIFSKHLPNKKVQADKKQRAMHEGLKTLYVIIRYTRSPVLTRSSRFSQARQAEPLTKEEISTRLSRRYRYVKVKVWEATKRRRLRDVVWTNQKIAGVAGSGLPFFVEDAMRIEHSAVGSFAQWYGEFVKRRYGKRGERCRECLKMRDGEAFVYI
jgi:hypothetical protein